MNSATTIFRVIEFNARRHARKVEAARVEICYSDSASEVLWMSKRDIAKNMKIYGQDPELVKALAAYSK